MWGRADEDGEVSEDLEVAEVLRERIIHKGEKKGKKRKQQTRAKLKVRRWICAPCVKVKDGGKEVRVKNWKPLRSHQCPQLWDCAEEEQVNFSHWSASLSSCQRVCPPPSPLCSSSPCFSIRSSIMLESAVSRNQAADLPQLLQEDPAPPPLHHRFYGTRRANGNLPQSPQIYITINMILLLLIIINVFILFIFLHLLYIKRGGKYKLFSPSFLILFYLLFLTSQLLHMCNPFYYYFF